MSPDYRHGSDSPTRAAALPTYARVRMAPLMVPGEDPEEEKDEQPRISFDQHRPSSPRTGESPGWSAVTGGMGAKIWFPHPLVRGLALAVVDPSPTRCRLATSHHALPVR
jgi:hypothetical protein